MFKFLNRKADEPLNKELRKWHENAILWLQQEFSDFQIFEHKIFTSVKNDFPFLLNNTEEAARDAFFQIAKHLNIRSEELNLEFFENVNTKIDAGSSILFLQNDPDSIMASGLYFDKGDDGKYTIGIDKLKIENPELLIATIAHELAHVKLLGEKKIDENDEFLTDVATVYFGFGIFNANSCFNFFKNSESWGYNGLGYLKQDEWAYALALYSYLRNEKNPTWVEFLNKTLQKDFIALNYILNNHEQVFSFEEEV